MPDLLASQIGQRRGRRRRYDGIDEIGFVHSSANKLDFAVFKFAHDEVSFAMW